MNELIFYGSIGILLFAGFMGNPLAQTILLRKKAEKENLELKDMHVGWFGQGIAVTKDFKHLYAADHFFNGEFFHLRQLRTPESNPSKVDPKTGEVKEYEIKIRVDSPGRKYRKVTFKTESEWEEWNYYIEKVLS